MLCVSDARTEQELGRYDRRSGQLAVDDQAHVYEVAQALWDFLAGNGPGGAPADPVPPLGAEGSNPDEPEDLEVWAAEELYPAFEEYEFPERAFPGSAAAESPTRELREVRLAPETYENAVKEWQEFQEAESTEGFDADQDFDPGEYREVYRQREMDERRDGFGSSVSVALEIVEALTGADVPETPAMIPVAISGVVPMVPAAASVAVHVAVPAAPASPVVPAVPLAPAVTESAGGRARGKAGRVVDRRLGRLRRDGWAVLAPTGKQSGAEFDRLVIGPPGVFAITLKHGDTGELPSAPATESSDARAVHFTNADGDGDAGVPGAATVAAVLSAPVAASIPGIFGGGRRDADFAARMLSAASGMAVKVTPMLAFVGAGTSGVTAYPPSGRRGDDPPGGVLIARGEDVADVLWGLPSVYSPQERRQISDIARRADLWRPG